MGVIATVPIRPGAAVNHNPQGHITMFRRIRIRAGSANLYPYNMPSGFLKHTGQTLPFQSVVVLVVVSTTSYADPHNRTSVRRFKVHPADCERPPGLG